MKKYILALVLCSGFLRAALLEAAPVTAEAEKRTISVSGEAEVKVVPDLAQITVGIETVDLVLQKAKLANDQKIKSILTALKGKGVEAKDIQTDFINIEPRFREETYDRVKDKQNRIFLGFFVRKTLVVQVKDVPRFDEILSSAVEAGAEIVQDIQFQTTKLRQHRDTARKLAIEAAKQKAVDLAGALGQKVGRPININETYGGWNYYGGSWGSRGQRMMAQNAAMDAGGSSEEGTVLPGQISVKANVSVVFELE